MQSKPERHYETPIQYTQRVLAELKAEHEKVLVAYSFGKDSLVVMDFARRVWGRKNVEAFHVELVPGLPSVRAKLEETKRLWPGLVVHTVPHWLLPLYLNGGIYCDAPMERVREYKLKDIYEGMMLRTGTNVVLTGAKDKDSLWRKRFLSQIEHWRAAYPIRNWSKFDVLAYLKQRKLPIPENASKKNATGVDLSTPSLLWMHDHAREDFDHLRKFFPYIEAVVRRREWHGVS